MSRSDTALLTFPDAQKSLLSIRAKALVFVDPRSRRLREAVEGLAATPLPVLIQGESGTGKELLVRHIHRQSERPGLFVALSAGTLSAAHGEAELFGHAPPPIRAVPAAGPVGSVRPPVAPSTSMKSPTCPCRCRPSC